MKDLIEKRGARGCQVVHAAASGPGAVGRGRSGADGGCGKAPAASPQRTSYRFPTAG